MTNFFHKILDRFPLLVKSAMSGVFFAAGDYCTQKYFSKKEYDLKRNINFFLVGTMYFGPMLHVWYSKLLPKMASRFFSNWTKKKRVLGQTLLDQCLFGPVLYSGFFYCYGLVEEGEVIKGLKTGHHYFKQKIVQTLAADIVVWPPLTYFNLFYVPMKFRFLFFNGVSFFWDMLLCYILYR